MSRKLWQMIEDWEHASEIGLTQLQRRAFEECATDLREYLEENEKRRPNAEVRGIFDDD